MKACLALVVPLAAAAAMVGVRAQPASACSCAYPNLQRDLPRADAALVGTVLARRVEHPHAPVFSSGDPAFLTFKVERAVKGSLPSILVVTTTADDASCGLALPKGDRMGLLLDRHGRRYASGSCSQVVPYRLAAHTVPGARLLAVPDGGSRWVWWLVGAGAGGIVALAAGGFALRRLGSR